MKQVPEKLTGLSAYRNGSEYLGVVDVELPDLEAMSETLSGAGIAGEVDSPTIGHFSAMTVKLNWRVLEKASFKLARQEAQQLDFRGSIQVFDNASGSYQQIAVKVTIRALPKTMPLGKLAAGAVMDNSNELEVIYIKIMHNNQTMVEIDKFNYICIIDGTDYLAQVRANLGM